MNGGGGIAQTFSDTGSALSYLQGRYGTADWQSYEYVREELWSYVTYPLAGAVTFNFFGQTPGGTITVQDTNMQTPGALQGGQHFLVQSIRCKLRLGAWDLTAFTGTDATTFVSDLLDGFAQAGVLVWKINARDYLTLPNPFLWAPPGGGQEDLHNRGLTSAVVSAYPYATLNNRRQGQFVVDPQVLIESGQTFSITLNYFSGLVPIIGTTIVTSNNPLKIGVELSGQLFRPMQ